MLDKLEMFIALANERHFGRAAEVAGVTQPTLSSAIRQLEGQLGVQLVRRGSRFQGLTAEGDRALDWALRIVADTRALRAEMRAAQSGGLDEDLRIGVIPTALPAVAELTVPFFARYPGVRVTLLSRSSDEIHEQIERLELHAGLTYLEDMVPRRLVQVPLYREEYCLLVRDDAGIGGEAISWAEVSRQPLCLLTRDMRNRQIIDRHLAAAGSLQPPKLESNSVIVLVSHVLTGKWATVVPVKMAELFATDGSLRAIPIRSVGPIRSVVGLVAPEREPRTPGVAALFDLARKLSGLRAGTIESPDGVTEEAY